MSCIDRLLRLFDEAYRRKSWHGTNLRGSVRGLSAAQAGWRARPRGRSIADIVVHCAYWKYAVRRRLRGDPRGSFALRGSNWFALPSPVSQSCWREYLALLEKEHRALRATIAELEPKQLDTVTPGRKLDQLALIHGIILHDIYHAGQIQVIKGVNRVKRAELRVKS